MSTFGEELRRERELRRISLREVSEATKINLRYLDALEQNDFEHLPGGVFNKGFVRAYAQYIGVDPESMVDAYLLEEQAQGRPAAPETEELLRGIRQAVGDEDEASPVEDDRRSVPMIAWASLAIVAVALLVTVAIWLWPEGSGAAEPVAESEPGPAIEIAPEEPVETTAADDNTTAEGTAEPPAEEPTTDPDTPESAPPEEETGSDSFAPGAVELADSATPEPEVAPSATGAAAGAVIRARVIVDRATSGRLNCDNRRVEVFDGLPAGTELRVECHRFLELDAADGGGLRVGLAGAAPTALVADGVPLTRYRIVPDVSS